MNSDDHDMSDVREENAMVEEVTSIGPMYLQADPIIEIPHIDFIFGDPQLKVNDCDLVIQIMHSHPKTLTHPSQHSHLCYTFCVLFAA